MITRFDGKTLEEMVSKGTLSEVLEAIIDRVGIVEMLEAQAEICREKAQHLYLNWQDEKSGKSWERIARKLEAVVDRARREVS